MLSEIPDGERARPTLDLDLENLPVERTLGVQWDVEKDAFLFKVRVLQSVEFCLQLVRCMTLWDLFAQLP